MMNCERDMENIDNIIQTLETIMVKALYQNEIPIIAGFSSCNSGQIGKNIVFNFPVKSKPRIQYTPAV